MGLPAAVPLGEHPQLQGRATRLQNLGAKSNAAKRPSPLLGGTGDCPRGDQRPLCWERRLMPADAGARLRFN